jgi:hypothetical protein
MSVPRIGFGRPQECHGRCLLPVVTLFSECRGGAAIGSAAVLAFFIIEGERVYFTALSEEITLQKILQSLEKSGETRTPFGRAFW